MAAQKVGVITDCVCDLSKIYLQEHKIDIIYFLIETDSGFFTDTEDITSDNIIEYLQDGGEKSFSMAPPPKVYRKVFENALAKYEEVIFIGISRGVSRSCENADKAVEEMGEAGKKVHVFDSKHLSTGMGHMVIKAAELAEGGMDAQGILPVLEGMIKRVSTSFITINADYLYRNGKISNSVKTIVDKLNVHPVLTMAEGEIKLKTFYGGNYEKASLRYVRKELRKVQNIEMTRIFITYAGCSTKKIEQIKMYIKKICPKGNILVTKASATVSGNCGPGTFGVIFIREEKMR